MKVNVNYVYKDNYKLTHCALFKKLRILNY